MSELSTIWSVLVDWLAHGLLRASPWQVLVTTLVMTHITIVAITVFLHRSQAHRSLDLHPIPSHFFRFWLWMTSGMVTKEWVAIHRKHHAKCETKDDPHSPVAHGIKTVLLRGSELYRAEAKVQETLKKFGHNTPDDWLERHVYTGRSKLGVSLMLVINVLLFGALGLTVWAVQMLWSPIHAAGIINGLGHWWGYRNFEAADASTNISPWGIWIGGEELHNNHHTFPTSAKLSVKPFEFDIGWGYIRVLEMMGLAKVRKTAPQLKLGAVRPVADSQTLEALIANRYEVMAQYATNLRKACAEELDRLKQQGAQNTERWNEMRLAQRWLHRDDQKIPADVKALVAKACDQSPSLTKLVTMREELRQLWTRTNVSGEQLVVDLQGWCQRAEGSGIAALQEFARTLRSARA
ncbi:fatty acid desaturase [Sphaerotilus montanus]|jgi:stearoyl-CoA desaturase (delta-9 desaturase)|uniref:Stearoyl-CoA desaturase (Delta-9 desaturase) n=1 Tax=Sphaerotilus montanus TaxID=522889 RepID=A0A7Y9QY07_9BURK|nr:fatty acid desaturase [Sphaerotilus montanus]NYG33547.1 stearoyl-CoA desaturase (delta-9 desaturase) [Sphaerotilus montanus]NZD57418.1 fatty acid desaturase [Sphaerotilus montanus]